MDSLYFLCFSTPHDGDNAQGSKTMVEFQSRKTTIGVASSIIKAAAKLLSDMQALPCKLINSAWFGRVDNE